MDIFVYWLHQALGLHLEEEHEREEEDERTSDERREQRWRR